MQPCFSCWVTGDEVDQADTALGAACEVWLGVVVMRERAEGVLLWMLLAWVWLRGRVRG